MLFQLKKSDTLDLMKLGKMISIFQTRDLPKLNTYYNYYNGKMEISYKVPRDFGQPCHKVVVNFCKNVVMNYSGYMTGKPIAYTSDNNIDNIQEVLDYNDVNAEDTELLRTALIFGRACELNYIDEDGKQRFKVIDPRECVPIYDDTVERELLYGVRFYKNDLLNDDEYIVEVYDNSEIKIYRSTMGFSSFELLEVKPHFFKQVPITFFDLNAEQESIFAQIMSLNDAYNSLLSGGTDAFDLWSDAYLVLKGVRADEDDLESVKANRVLMIDSDADAQFLTKQVSDTQIDDMLDRINDLIHKIAMSPDFSQESFGTSSGIALKYRLLGFENNAGNIESYMRKALQKRIELIAEILYLKGGEEVWRDINIHFTRNLPENIDDTATMINSLRGVVSQKTLLSQISFIDDPDEEMERIKEEQNANLNMYSFINSAVNNEDTEEE